MKKLTPNTSSIEAAAATVSAAVGIAVFLVAMSSPSEVAVVEVAKPAPVVKLDEWSINGKVAHSPTVATRFGDSYVTSDFTITVVTKGKECPQSWAGETKTTRVNGRRVDASLFCETLGGDSHYAMTPLRKKDIKFIDNEFRTEDVVIFNGVAISTKGYAQAISKL